MVGTNYRFPAPLTGEGEGGGGQQIHFQHKRGGKKMKKLLKVGVLLLGMAVAMAATSVQAFNSGTHLYIAERVYSTCWDKTDLDYGSIAPDLAIYVAHPEKWPTAFDDTHHTFIDFSPYAWDLTQKWFAKGWATHNEVWGADYYAHICYPAPGSGTTGYVIGKAGLLLEEIPSPTGNPVLDLEIAHDLIEIAVDVLLKQNDPKLGEKLLDATVSRSLEDRNLLARVFVWESKPRTDWLTLASTELTFRGILTEYAMALSLSTPQHMEPLAILSSQFGQRFYGVQIPPEKILGVLKIAVSLCSDYKPVIDTVILGIKTNPYLPK